MYFTILLHLITGFAQAALPMGFIAENIEVKQQNQKLFTLSLHKKLHDNDKSTIEHLINKYAGEGLKFLETPSFPTPAEKYYLGFNGRIKIIINFDDHHLKKQEYLATNLCDNLKCDLIYRGDEIISYTYDKQWQQRPKKHLNVGFHFVKKYEVLSFKNKFNKKIQDNLIENMSHDFVFWGKPGEIVYYKTKEVTKPHSLEHVGTFIEKNHIPFEIKNTRLSNSELNKLIENSNADCGYILRKDSLRFCKSRDKKYKHPFDPIIPIKTEIVIKGGKSILEIDSIELRKKLSRPIVRDSNADLIYDPEFVTIYRQEFIEPIVNYGNRATKYPWLNQFENFFIEYIDDDNVIAKLKLKNLEKVDMEKLHELIIESLNPDKFKIYEWSYDNQLALVGEFNSNIIPALERSSERVMKKRPSYSFGTRIEDRYMKITASSSLNYLRRDKNDALSFFALYGDWWAPKSDFGFKAHANIFTYQYNVVQSSPPFATTETNGSSGEYSLMGGYRFNTKFGNLDEARAYMGVSKKHILIIENQSLGNLKYLNLNFQLEGKRRIKKMVYSGNIQVSKVWSAEAEMAGFDPGEGTGLWYQVEAKASYPIFKNIFLSWGGLYRTGNIKFDSGRINFKEIGIFIGLDILKTGY